MPPPVTLIAPSLKSDDYAGSTNTDVFLDILADPNHAPTVANLPDGRIQGNGGDWIELVVTQDHLDIRGWQVRWAEFDNEANGSDIWYGNGSVEQGILEFSQNAVWSNLRAGTIITIVEEQYIYVDTTYGDNRTYNVVPGNAEAVIDLSTDLSFNPDADDWWINVSTLDESDEAEPLITSIHNVSLHQVWDWGCGNDNWQGHVYDPVSQTIVFGPVGENVSQWGGSGINSNEVGRLEENPSSESGPLGFDDAKDSSLGMPNEWGTPVNVQDFALLRAWYNPPQDCDEAIAMGYVLPHDFNQNCYVDLVESMTTGRAGGMRKAPKRGHYS